MFSNVFNAMVRHGGNDAKLCSETTWSSRKGDTSILRRSPPTGGGGAGRGDHGHVLYDSDAAKNIVVHSERRGLCVLQRLHRLAEGLVRAELGYDALVSAYTRRAAGRVVGHSQACSVQSTAKHLCTCPSVQSSPASRPRPLFLYCALQKSALSASYNAAVRGRSYPKDRRKVCARTTEAAVPREKEILP